MYPVWALPGSLASQSLQLSWVPASVAIPRVLGPRFFCAWILLMSGMPNYLISWDPSDPVVILSMTATAQGAGHGPLDAAPILVSGFLTL